MHCLPKVGQHTLYMLNSVLYANLHSSQGKGLRKNTLNEEQILFLTSLKTFYFYRPCWETNFFFKKNPSPPP